MDERILRDKTNRKIGVIRTENNGTQTLYDAANRKQASYDSRADITRDASGRQIGRGNRLDTLLTAGQKKEDVILRDRMNRKNGVIKTDNNGVQTLYDPMNHKVGSYDPRMDTTRDAMNRAVGRGNQLEKLLQSAQKAEDQVLRDKMSRKTGVIKTDSSGVKTLYDAMNRKQGAYDPRMDTTRDVMNRAVGRGNQLEKLLQSAQKAEDQVLRDKMNRKTGVIKTDDSGVKTLYDAMNRKQGTYDPRTDTTRDAMSRSIGRGNQLEKLLETTQKLEDQVLRDKMNRKTGVIKTDNNGVKTLYDAMNRKQGTYDPRTNTTKDDMNRYVGKGDLLLELLHKEDEPSKAPVLSKQTPTYGADAVKPRTGSSSANNPTRQRTAYTANMHPTNEPRRTRAVAAGGIFLIPVAVVVLIIALIVKKPAAKSKSENSGYQDGQYLASVMTPAPEKTELPAAVETTQIPESGDGLTPYLIEGGTGHKTLLRGYYDPNGVMYILIGDSMETVESVYGWTYLVFAFDPEQITVKDAVGTEHQLTACYIQDEDQYYTAVVDDDEWIPISTVFGDRFTIISALHPDAYGITYPIDDADTQFSPVGEWICIGQYDPYVWAEQVDYYQQIPQQYVSAVQDTLELRINDTELIQVLNGEEVLRFPWAADGQTINVTLPTDSTYYGYYLVDENTIHEFYADSAIYIYTRK